MFIYMIIMINQVIYRTYRGRAFSFFLNQNAHLCYETRTSTADHESVIFRLHNLSKLETLQTMWHRYYKIYHTSYYIYDYKSAEKDVKRECTSLCHQSKQLYKAGKITHLFVPPRGILYMRIFC